MNFMPRSRGSHGPSIAAIAFAVAALAALPAQADSSRWIHVRVQKGGGEADAVRVNLPMSLAQVVVPLIEKQMQVRMQERHDALKVDDLRKMWAELKKQRDTELVAVDSPEAKIRVSLARDNLLIRSAKDSKAKVDVKVPVAVVDALLSGSGETFDVSAAIRALEDLGRVELVSIEDAASRVQIWIDDRSEG